MKTFDQLIITTGFLASASPAMADEKPEADSGRPNILFILSDDHTSQAWGIYGGILSEYVKNENIRRLAAEGLSFKPLVHRVKMDLAGWQVQASSMPLTLLADVLGYADQAAFSKAFREAYGMSPSAWRRLHRPAATG